MVGHCTFAFFALLLAPPAENAKPPAGDVHAERVMARAGLETDAASLLAFFRKRTLSDADRAQVASWINQLGAPAYADRQRASAKLETAGPGSARLLRAALSDPDPEVARRAKRILRVIRKGPGPEVPAAAARLLAVRKPAGATSVLLRYIPFADDANVEEAVRTTLADLCLHDGKADPLLLGCLSDPEPDRRAAAVSVIGQSNDATQRRMARPLLRDPATKVRFEAARTLFSQGDKAAVAPLLAFLNEGPPEYAGEAEELLGRLSETDGPRVYMDVTRPESRNQCRAAWETWWKANVASFDSARVRQGPRLRGWTAFADLDRGTIVEVDADHKEQRRFTGLKGPVDFQILNNGNVLVAENHGRRISEQDPKGHVRWEVTVAALPASCQRLANGCTFIATHNEVREYDRAGKEVFKLSLPEQIFAARRLHNGYIAVLTTRGNIAIFDRAGNQLRSFETGGVANWSSLDVLPNGHFLVCSATGIVIEFDAFGKRVWEHSAPHAVAAHRLANGNTLISTSEDRRVVEVDRFGKEVWGMQTEGRPWHANRR